MGIKERKEREKAMRRQGIQNAAKNLFIAKGFSSTTMEDIARNAELSAATIYQYFRSKEDLYASLNLITLQCLFDEVDKVFNDKALSAEGKIIGFKDAMYTAFRYEPLILRNIFHVQLEDDTLLSLSKELLGQLNRQSLRVMTMISDVYEEGVRQGEFRPGGGLVHADIIWGVFTGLVIWERAKKRSLPKRTFLKILF